jgi:hypothetical protein
MSVSALRADPPGETLTILDSGLGTTFERWALNRYLSRLQDRLGLKTVLEGPGDGMTGISGINSLVLALGGADVTVALTDSGRADLARKVWGRHLSGHPASWRIASDGALPSGPRLFDLVWNFNVMTRQERPSELLGAICGLSRRFVLIFVPNRKNYSFFLHRLHHRVAKQPWDHGAVELMSPGYWRKALSGFGFGRCETVWLDCPWWPDIVDFGQLIGDFFPFLRHAARRAQPRNRMAWPWDGLPYYDPEKLRGIESRIERLAFFEKSRQTWIKKRFAHHVGVLAEWDG